MSLARTANRKWRSVDPVLRALIISVLVHVILFGSWKLGEGLGISQKLPLFNLIKKVEAKLLPVPLIATAPAQQEREIQLTFVEVDLSKIAEEPKDAKHYGAVNTEAANPIIEKETETPKIDGKIKEVSKLTDNSKSKAKPLEPTPIAPAELEEEEKPKSKPKEVQPAGDLAFAKPDEKPRKSDGASDSEKEEPEQPKRRPRTVAEAKAANAPGEKLKQDGGVKRYDLSGSFDVKGSIVGSYDQRFIEAVRQCWYDMLDNVSATKPGLVRLEFRINHRGQISEMRVAESTVNELQAVICQQAIQKPAPYGEWPRAMRLELQGDYRDVTFTFTYH
ncbi:MAG: hypothetical protein H0X66_07800 [Verrucomicrobia bacterium]|nr:hypothetical protein [Verrucomicrobiota bacterium]